MKPNDLHFGHVPLPKSTYSPAEEASTLRGFSSIGIENNLEESLRKMGITRPADIQVNMNVFIETFSLNFIAK